MRTASTIALAFSVAARLAIPLAVSIALPSLVAACSRRAAAQDREAIQYESYRRPQKIVAGLALAPGLVVADVGAGRGLVTARIADAVAPSGRVVATDVDGAALAFIPHRPGIATRVVASDDPGLEATTYDRIFLGEVDHLLPDRAVYLGKLMRTLRPGGFIAVSNRLLYRDALVAAARAAGLRATELPLDLPAHFFMRLEPQ